MKYQLKFPHIDNDETQIVLSVAKEHAREFNDIALQCIITHMDEPYVTCFVVDGDDPLDACNRKTVCDALRSVKALVDDFNKPIKLYTHYSFSELTLDDSDINEILQYINILVANDTTFKKVDGRYYFVKYTLDYDDVIKSTKKVLKDQKTLLKELYLKLLISKIMMIAVPR